MAYALLLVAIVFIASGVRGTHGELFSLLRGDFTGPRNFLVWMVAIVTLGALGFIRPIRPITNAFIVLILLVFILSNRGFFAEFTRQIRSSETAAGPPNAPLDLAPTEPPAMPEITSPILPDPGEMGRGIMPWGY